ncbi:MAG: hypothetical protein LBH98_08755 [Chitinispirillales bacterium]|jgi:hypothetical protein|nr:hypothetical protein [Chitinispirillales bacterium]
MKKIVTIIISAVYFSTFADESASDFAPQTEDRIYYLDDFKIEESEKENLNESHGENIAIYKKKPKNKIVPIILLNKREISISAAGVKSMKIAIFSVNGRKIASGNVSGEKAAFTIPKTAKNAVIVQIDADGKFFSQKILLE